LMCSLRTSFGCDDDLCASATTAMARGNASECCTFETTTPLVQSFAAQACVGFTQAMSDTISWESVVQGVTGCQICGANLPPFPRGSTLCCKGTQHCAGCGGAPCGCGAVTVLHPGGAFPLSSQSHRVPYGPK
jgi:hypothetical protein